MRLGHHIASPAHFWQVESSIALARAGLIAIRASAGATIDNLHAN